jgi:nitric oxide dioxygenase
MSDFPRFLVSTYRTGAFAPGWVTRMHADYVVLVQESFARLKPRAAYAAALFYDNLFALEPKLRPLFRGDLAEQGARVMPLLADAVGLLGEIDKLVPMLRGLGRRHVELGLTPAHYFSIGVALIWTLEDTLGAEFTPAQRKAWSTAYALMSDAMIESARNMPKAA